MATAYHPASGGPTIEPWVGLRGYTVIYPRVDASTLETLRAFQLSLPSGYPGWLSRLDYATPTREVRLHVFPRGEFLSSFWRTIPHYTAFTR
jgi:hypothetical protein